LRNILHDWPDAKCREILQNIVSALGPDSVILIDEMVLPATGVHWQATQLDFTMMTALASMERTEEQWHALLDSAGLKAQKMYTYTLSLRDSIIVAVPK
jgi:demethylsterigmatocystin 6-O-methyltransferase